MKEKREYRVGDIVTAEFIKNQHDGRKPIILVDGMVGFVDSTYRGQFLQEHSVWQFEVSKIKESALIVMPIQEIKTAMQNQREIKQRMQELSEKYIVDRSKTSWKRTKSDYPKK